MSKKLIAIAFTQDKTALKYRLQNTPRSLSSFEKFVSTKGAIYVNYYDKETRVFIRRAKISNE